VDRVDLLGGATIVGGLTTDTVMLSGGGSLVAGNGYLWQAGDFI
jgi:hypothetical protein